MTNRTMNMDIKKISEIEAQVDELNKVLKKLKEKVETSMEESGVNEVNTGKYIVRWTPVVSNKFDSTGFKKDHKDLYDEYIKQSEYRKFSYKEAC